MRAPVVVSPLGCQQPRTNPSPSPSFPLYIVIPPQPPPPPRCDALEWGRSTNWQHAACSVGGYFWSRFIVLILPLLLLKSNFFITIKWSSFISDIKMRRRRRWGTDWVLQEKNRRQRSLRNYIRGHQTSLAQKNYPGQEPSAELQRMAAAAASPKEPTRRRLVDDAQ